MLRNLLRENSQISSKDDLLNSHNERSERSKATKLWSDTLIIGHEPGGLVGTIWGE